MAIVSRDQVAQPERKRETHPCEPLGGDVVVRGLAMSEKLALFDGATSLGANQLMPRLLAVAVVDEADQPYFSAEQWDLWGGEHAAAAGALFDAAMRLSGFAREELRKKLIAHPERREAFRVGRALGMTVEQVGRMSALECAEWSVWLDEHPEADPSAWGHLQSMLLAALANGPLQRKHGSRELWKPSEFYAERWQKPPEPVDPLEWVRQLKAKRGG